MQKYGKKIIKALDARGFDFWTKCVFTSYFGAKKEICLILSNPSNAIYDTIRLNGEDWSLKIQIRDNFHIESIVGDIKQEILNAIPKKYRF